MRPNINRPSCFQLKQVIIAITLIMFSVSYAKAQSFYSTDGTTPMGLKPGTQAGSYALSGFDNVDLYNGNLNFRLPLLSIGGRGSTGHTVMLPIEQKWQVEEVKVQIDDYWQTFYYPTPEWWTTKRPGYGPGVMHARYGVFSTRLCTSDGMTRAWRTLTRLTFTASDGTEYELRDQLTGGAPHTLTPCATAGKNRGKVFITADGTSASFVSDTDIVDPYLSDGSSWADDTVSGYLMLRDGTRYRISGGYVMWMRDRNGNKISFAYGGYGVSTITDSLNRQVTTNYNVAEGGQYGTCDKITYKGFGGANRILRICYNSLANVLRAGYSLQTEMQLFGMGNSYSNYNPTLVAAVWLPDSDGVTRRYQFRYNSYGELARVELPTGGAVEYDHAGGMADMGYIGGVITDGVHMGIYRRVIERREYADGINLTNRTTYTRPEGAGSPTPGYVRVDQLNSGGTLLGRQTHYFHGNGASESILAFYPLGYSAWDEGKEYKTEAFDFNGTTVLRRTQHTWQGNGTMGGQTINPRITETFNTMEPSSANLVSKQTFTHDQYNNVTGTYEYDFGWGAAGSLVRRTQTSYVTTNNGYDYACDPASTCSATLSLSNVIHIRSLVSQISVYDAGGIERARSTHEYDNYTSDTNHAPLTNRTSISGLDAAFTTSYTTRGNGTGTAGYLLTNGSVTGSISAYAQFDIAGNVVKTIDGRGFSTTLAFADCFGSPDGNATLNSAPLELSSQSQLSYAFATSATNHLGHTAFTQFDYYLGRPVEVQDANGIVSSGYFNDVLDRPTQVVAVVNNPSVKSQTTFSYDDPNRIVTSTSDLNTYNDNLLKTQSLYDNLGRTFETRQYEGGANYIATKREYDALGRAYRISNPYRPWQSETPLWMTTTFDALGRTLTATTADNAVVNTNYSGNTVTASDQLGKSRKSVTDALGRLIQIYEDPTGLNYLTIYSYDVLDNLTTVLQGSQTRTFVYDSLKRLTSATNPESGTVSYQYDNNGNLTQRTDARGVVSIFAYDPLNRNTTIDYSDTPSINPDVSRFYDGATNGIGRFWYNYSGGNYSVGSNVEHSSIDTYDALGRPLVQRQLFKLNGSWGPTYQTSRTYNLAGGVATQTYPSGHITTYGYDPAGRTSSVAGNLGDGTNRTYTTAILYSPFGGMSKEQFGTTTPIYNKLFYNSRGQLAEIREGTTYSGPTDTGWERGAIINHYSGQCWGACTPTSSMTDNNGNLKQQDNWVPDGNGGVQALYVQQYDYDSLNRLQRVREGSWQQEYVYDRWGNRTIHQTNTYGTGIPKPNFGVDTTNNRLTAPGGYIMSYDPAGNLTNDTYTGAGNRVYDVENRMTQAWGGNSQWQYYTYNADGQRTRRKIDGVETWQIYGFGGELLAEYAANGAALSPQKEYGHRNGQLLVTATGSDIRWLVTDQLGTPRMIFDVSGGLANVKRHDYLPFGEELYAPVSGRSAAWGYGGADGVRQKFTGYEGDNESGLDFAQARYFASAQGRFTSPDPLMASARRIRPQSWNRYSYVGNNPTVFSDPSGMIAQPGSYSIHNYSGGRAAETASEGLSPWPSDDNLSIGTWNTLTPEQQRLFTTYYDLNYARPIGDDSLQLSPAALWNLSAAAANSGRATGSLLGYQLLNQSQLTSFIGVTSMWQYMKVSHRVAAVTEIRGDVKEDNFCVRGIFEEGAGKFIKDTWEDIPGSLNPPFTISRREGGYYDQPNGQFKMTADLKRFQSDVDYNRVLIRQFGIPTPLPNPAHNTKSNSDIRHGGHVGRHVGRYGAVPITRP